MRGLRFPPTQPSSSTTLATTSRRTRRLGRDNLAVSPVIGTILMVAITVVLAAVVFLMVQRFADDGGKGNAPGMAFDQDLADDQLHVTSGPPAQNPRDWDQLTVTGCTAPASGAVDAGDTLTACSGTVTIVDEETNTVVYQNDFQ